MELSKAGSAISFVGALVIGTAVGFVADFADDRSETVVVSVTSTAPLPVVETVPVRVENLIGVWRGTWGYGREDCTIEINRTEGNKFHGTLRKEGAQITIAGSLDPKLRRVFFHETKVLKLGPEMSEWSLGTNAGEFSRDGRILTGTGTDRWGSYAWDAAKE